MPLETNRRVLTWLRMYSAVEGTSKWNKLAHNVFTTSILVFNVMSIAVSINTFMETNAEDAVYTIVPFSAEINCIYIFIATLISRRKIATMINDLTKTCEKCKIFFKNKIQPIYSI